MAARGSTMEQPLSLNFQAETLHSGSYSFGQYEAESLSWERWSTFSHNRYLEEVEKFSKPGSVTEMKAYFEAHFRKKALLRESSSVSHDETEYKMSENNMADGLVNGGNTEYAKNEDSHFVHFDQSPDHSDYNRECQEIKFEGGNVKSSYVEHHLKSGSHNVGFEGKSENLAFKNSISDSMDNSIEIESAYNEVSDLFHFDESSDGSGSVGDGQDTKSGDGNPKTVYSEPLVVQSSSKVHPEPWKADDTNAGSDKLISVNIEPDLRVKQYLNDESVIASELFEGINMSSRCREVEKYGQLISEQCPNHSTKEPQGMKLTNPKSKSKGSFTEIRGSMPCEALNNTAKIHSRREAVNLVGRSKVKHPLQTSITDTRSVSHTTKQQKSEILKTKLRHQTTCSDNDIKAKIAVAPQPSTPERIESRVRQSSNRFPQTVNSTYQGISRSAALNFNEEAKSTKEECERLKTKFLKENKSDKELRVKKVVGPRPSTPGKFEHHKQQTVNRPIKIENSANQHIRQSTAFNIKCEERTERTKGASKLEEKLHTREAGKSPIQIKEKTETEIKQFRKSLMPLFSQEAALQGLGDTKGKATTAPPSRSSTPRRKLVTPNLPCSKKMDFVISTDDHPVAQAARSSTPGRKLVTPNLACSKETDFVSTNDHPRAAMAQISKSKEIDSVSTNVHLHATTVAQRRPYTPRRKLVPSNTTCSKEIDSVSTHEHPRALGSTNHLSVPKRSVSPMPSSRTRSCPHETAGSRNGTMAATMPQGRNETSSQGHRIRSDMKRRPAHKYIV